MDNNTIDNDLQERIMDCLCLVLKTERNIVENIKVDESLRNIGLNSLNYVQFIFMLEEEFDIRFDEEEMLIEYFGNISDIASMITKKLEQE